MDHSRYNINNLPQDCFGNIFSFLSLYDVLIYSSTSKTSLQRSLTQIHHRSNKLLISYKWKGTHIVEKEEEEDNDDDTLSAEMRIVKIPSVYERIVSLYKVISSSHPMKESMYELITLMKDVEKKKCSAENHQQQTNNNKYSYDLTNTNYNNNNNFQRLFLQMQQKTKVYKLHHHILQFAIYGNIVSNQSIARIHDNGHILDIDLDHYLGDVYIAHTLMGNISSGIVEGTSEKKWLDSLMTKTTIAAAILHPEDNHGGREALSSSPSSPLPSVLLSSRLITDYDARTWYQSWIFTHSTLLRTVALSRNERIQLGLSSDGTILKQIVKSLVNNMDGEDNNGVSGNSFIAPPPLPFQGLHKTKTMLHLYKNLYSDGVLVACFRDFGPLGPTFRGR